MIGDFNVWRCQRIQINKVFDFHSNSLPFTIFKMKDVKYALVLIDGKYGPRIDENAQFFPEAGKDEDYNQKGFYLPPKNVYYEISQYSYSKTFPHTINIYANLTLITTKNGKSESQLFGVFMTYDNSLIGGSFTDKNEKFKFIVNDDETFELRGDLKYVYYPNDPNNPSLIFKMEYKTITINQSGIIGKTNLDFSVLGFFDFKFNISKIELPVAIKSSLNKDDDASQGVLTKMQEIDIDIHGQFRIPFAKDEYYYVLKIKSSKYPMKSSYLFMKATKIVVLSENVQKIGNDVYYLYCDNDTILIPIRRESGEGTLNIEYLLSHTEDPQNMRINKSGTSLIFKGSNFAKALIVDAYLNEYHILDNAKTPLTYYSIDIDSNLKILGIQNPNYQNNSEPVLIIPTHAYFGANQTSIEVDLRELYSNTKESGKTSFNFYIICEWKDVTTIRMINKNYEIDSEVNNNIATFTIEISPEKEINDTTQSIAICSNSKAINCALKLIPGSGYYQLIRIPTKEGLNTTVRGRPLSFIKAPANESYYYHKMFEGDFLLVRSYPEKTPIQMTLTDVYPYDNIETNKKIIQEYNDTNATTATPVPHNLKDAYRRFCLKDNFLNNLPFSMDYLSKNYVEFFEQLGVNESIDDSQFTINDNDECIRVDIQMIEKDIETVTTRIIDLGVMNETIQLEYTSPIIGSEDIKSEKKINKKSSILH